MNSRGALVALLLLTIAPSGARANGDPVGGAECLLPLAAPKGSARLVWRSKDGEGAPGFWISEAAMKRASSKIDACVTGWSTCEVNLAVEKGKRFSPGWKTWTISITAAIATGYIAGKWVR